MSLTRNFSDRDRGKGKGHLEGRCHLHCKIGKLGISSLKCTDRCQDNFKKEIILHAEGLENVITA